MRSVTFLCAMLCGLVLPPSVAQADTLYLKDGRTIRGVIVHVDENFVKIQKGAEGARIVSVFRRSEIASMELSPPDLGPERDVAYRHIREGQIAEAVRTWKYIATLQPNKIENQLGFARALRLGNRWDEAMEAAMAAQRLDPRDARPYLEMGETALARGDHRKAILRALDAIRWLGDSPAAGYILLGRGHERGGGEGDAIDAYRTALKHAPRHAQAFARLGRLLLQKGRYGEAETLARDRVARIPRERKGWLVLGRALYHQRRYGQAIEVFKKAITLGGPGFDRARVFLLISEARREGTDPLGRIKEVDHVLAWELDAELRRRKP